MRQLIRQIFDAAVVSGSLIFTESTISIIEEAQVPFQIRLAPALAKKPQRESTAVPVREPRPNPFLPHDAALYVTSYDHHHVLLNKFAVVRDHVLLTTKGELISSSTSGVLQCYSRLLSQKTSKNNSLCSSQLTLKRP